MRPVACWGCRVVLPRHEIWSITSPKRQRVNGWPGPEFTRWRFGLVGVASGSGVILRRREGRMKFTKMHGIGNDYVYVSTFDQPAPADPARLAAAISDRHF